MRFKKRDGLVCTIFSVITCGIYGIYFWYCYGEDVNELCAEDGKHTPNYIVAWLLSLITCGIYGIYWTYNLASRLDTAGRKYQVNVESPVFFTLFMNIPVLGYLYACDIMNKFAESYLRMYPGGNGGYSYQQSGPGPVPPYGQEEPRQSMGQQFGEDLKSTFMDVGRSVKQSVSDAMRTVSPEQEPVRTCRNCGAEIPAGKQYCTRCGFPVDAPGPQDGGQPGPDMVMPPQPAEGQSAQAEDNGAMRPAGDLSETPAAGPEMAEFGQNHSEAEAPDLCPNCGSVIQKGDKFCIHCGYRL